MNSRTRVLAILLLVVLGAVVADGMLKRSDAGEIEDEGSARTQYVRRAAIVERKQALIDREEAFSAALEETNERWAELRSSLIEAPSSGLAEAQLRDEVLEFVGRRRIKSSRTGRIESSAINGHERLRLIELGLELESPSSRVLYELIDGLERMRGLATHVSSIEMAGPSTINQGRRLVTARVTIKAIALVEGNE